LKELSDRLVNSYGKRYGVEFHKLGGLGWTTRLNAAGEEQQVGLNVAGQTVIFSVYPLLKVECRGCKPALAEYLLFLNADTHLVKYGVDENWYIQLTVQFPLSEFAYGQFAAALDAIRRSVAGQYEEIRRRASE
jgi:hypothetical protein